MAGQPERAGVRRGDVSTGLPCTPGGGGCFLTEKLSHMTDLLSHLTYPVTVLNQFLFFFSSKYTCAILNLHFSTKDHWPYLKALSWWNVGRFLFFILALYSSKWFVFFFFSREFFFSSFCKKLLIGFTSWLIFLFPDFFNASCFFFLFFFVRSGESCVFTYCISTVFKFLVAAGSLDKEEQSKPLVCLHESESLKKTKWRCRKVKGRCVKGLFRGKWVHRKLRTDTLHVLLARWKGCYLNLSSRRADVLWMYLKLWIFTASQSHQTQQPMTLFTLTCLIQFINLPLCWTFLNVS